MNRLMAYKLNFRVPDFSAEEWIEISGLDRKKYLSYLVVTKKDKLYIFQKTSKYMQQRNYPIENMRSPLKSIAEDMYRSLIGKSGDNGPGYLEGCRYAKFLIDNKYSDFLNEQFHSGYDTERAEIDLFDIMKSEDLCRLLGISWPRPKEFEGFNVTFIDRFVEGYNETISGIYRKQREFRKIRSQFLKARPRQERLLSIEDVFS